MVEPVRRAMMPEPLTINATDSLVDAARRMRWWGLSEVFVVDGHDRFVGRLTERDIVVAAIAADRHPATVTVEECCDRTVPAVDADEPAEHAVELLRRHGLRQLPVVEDDRLIGTAWATDFVTAAPGPHRRPSAPDATRTTETSSRAGRR